MSEEQLEPREEQKYPITKTRSKEVNELMSYYPKDLQDNLKLTNDEVKNLKRELREVDGIHVNRIPLNCVGDKCIYAKRCTLARNNIAPVGFPCPIESMLMEKWKEEYILSLNVNVTNKIEMDSIRDMVECDLLDMRTSNELAEHGLYDFPIMGTNEKGQPYRGKIESIAIGIKMKFKKRKDSKIDGFLATRKSKAQFGISKQVDPSQYAAKMMKNYKDVTGENIEDAKHTDIIEGDDM